MKKILITGGPVYGKLDDVKIITNKFRGGLMAQLAYDLWEKHGRELHVTYLTTKGSKLPINDACIGKEGYPVIVYQDGFDDYRAKVLELAPQMDCVVLGAAVANLIPVKPFPGKFPSHNYKVGDIIPIDFTIAPRIIDEVKKVNPNTTLFGFKLLSGVDHDELIRAAYEVCLMSKATAVFANDATNLTAKYAVTKERSIIPMDLAGYTEFIWDHMNDEYFHTECSGAVDFDNQLSSEEYEASIATHKEFWKLYEEYKDKFGNVPGTSYKFGTIAVRALGDKFVTTSRGKNEFDETVLVREVNFDTKIIKVFGPRKPSLNTPLLGKLFKDHPEIDHIIHFHEQLPFLPTAPYVLPGTVMESRLGSEGYSFNIEHHGCILIFDKEGRRL